MSVTFCVSKFDTLSVLRERQSQNISLMFVTFSVFRFSMPSIVVKYSQPRNHPWQLVGRALANEASKTTFVMIFVL